jgi:signal transduction histidine kinase
VDHVASPSTAAPLEVVAALETPTPATVASSSRWRGWRRDILPSIGLSPTFRAYLFVGSILAILAFLLYNESMIRQLRDQEKSNVDLYAKLISLSPLAEDEQSIAIFQEISIDSSIDFPIIVTDHTGRITLWNNIDVAALQPDRAVSSRFRDALLFWRHAPSPRAPEDADEIRAALAPLVERMDAKNEPIPFYTVPEVTGKVYAADGDLVITDARGWLVEWQGAHLPDRADTTQVARTRVADRVARMELHTQPLVFQTPVGVPGFVYSRDGNVVVADRSNQVLAWRGPGVPASTDTSAAARQQVARLLMDMGGIAPPLTFEIPARSYFHYGDSKLVRRMSRATYVQIIALVLFLLVAYLGFRNIKRSEQRSIWVGMAKETAHQLGTPLSSLSGWLELIETRLQDLRGRTRAEPAAVDELRHMVGEMHRDMQRLSQIASRFSQIGSVPELRMADVVAILEETITYFRTRGPQFGHHEISLEVHDEVPPIPLNPDLIGWVFENLFKNAIDALEDGTGSIRIEVQLPSEMSMVQLTFGDSGRGIVAEHVGRIFDPGFSTKKRGWGLGLAFVKRIVEDCHGGRISVVRSAPGQGTVFEILLPLG